MRRLLLPVLAWLALAALRPGPTADLRQADPPVVAATAATALCAGFGACGPLAALWWSCGYFGRRWRSRA